MRRKPYPVTDMSGGLVVDRDPIFLADSESLACENIYIKKGLISSDINFKQKGNQLNEEVLWIDIFYKMNGEEYLIVATKTKVYYYNPISNTFTQIYSGWSSSTELVCGTQGILASGEEVYILTNGIDPMIYWTGSGSASPMSLTYDVRPTYIAWYQSHLIMGSTLEGGYPNKRRVFWSKVGDPEETRISYGAGFIDLHDTADWVTCLVPFKRTCLIMKERSIWELVHVGGSVIFEPSLLVDGIGTSSPNSVVNIGEEIMFFGHDSVYLYDGVNLRSISDKINRMLYTTGERIVSGEHLNKVHSAYVEELNEYWLAIPETSSIPTKILKYNFLYDSWHIREQEATAFGFYSSPPDAKWNDYTTETWSSLSRIWSFTKLASLSPTTLIATSNGIIYEDDRQGDPVEQMQFVTKDFMLAPAMRIRELRVDKKGGPLYVSYSTDRGETWSNPVELSRTDNFFEHKIQYNFTCKNVRFKLFTANSNYAEIRFISPVYIERARTMEGDRWLGY